VLSWQNSVWKLNQKQAKTMSITSLKAAGDESQPRIVFVLTGLGLGGAEMQVLELAKRLHVRGWPISIVSMTAPQPLAKRFTEAGMEVEFLGMKEGVPNPLGLLRLALILRHRRPMVVHSHMVHANILARAVRLLVRVPVVVCTAHSMIEGARWREWAYRVTDRLATLTTAISKAAVERYVRVGAVPRQRMRFLPNGVDIQRFQPNRASRSAKRAELGLGDCFAWLAVGRLVPAKNYALMLRSFASVQNPNAKLIIAGEGPLRTQLENLARQLDISDRVHFLGPRNDVTELMNAVDAYVMSSDWEGMPMVLLEASASGLPIVATNVGGNAEVVRHGITGLLVPPQQKDALASAMTTMMSLPPVKLAVMGRSGRELTSVHYNIESIVDSWESLYLELLDKVKENDDARLPVAELPYREA
jgi:glycosyltransferase involved in cell wall biosynthesis